MGSVFFITYDVPICLTAEKPTTVVHPYIPANDFNYHFQTHSSKNGSMYLENQIHDDSGRLILSPFMLKRRFKRWKVILSQIKFKRQTSKFDFLQVSISNRDSDYHKSRKKEALNLGFSLEFFSILKYRYSDDIAKATQQVRFELFEEVVDHLINRLKDDDCPHEIVRLAVELTGMAGSMIS
jgi:hypothetical protein